MKFRKGNRLKKVALRSATDPAEPIEMTGAQIGKMVVAVVAVIAFALMAAWFVGKI